MFHAQYASKLFAAHATKDSKSKFEEYSNQWRWVAKRSGDDAGSNRGSMTVANAALGGTSSTYAEDMYKLWMKDKTSVHSSWDRYFSNIKTLSSAPRGRPAKDAPGRNSFDKSKLIQYVNPKQSVTPSQSESVGDDGPIVIKIDIISKNASGIEIVNAESDVRSLKSGKSISSTQTSSSPVQKEVPSTVNVTSSHGTPANRAEPTRGTPPKTRPRLIHPPQERKIVVPLKNISETIKTTHPKTTATVNQPPQTPEVIIPKTNKAVESREFKDWQKHVSDFARVYHQPTKGEGPKFPVFGRKSETKTPSESSTPLKPTAVTSTNLKTTQTQSKPDLVGKLEKPSSFDANKPATPLKRAPQNPQNAQTQTAATTTENANRAPANSQQKQNLATISSQQIQNTPAGPPQIRKVPQEVQKSQTQTSSTVQPNLRAENANKTSLNAEAKTILPMIPTQQVQNPPVGPPQIRKVPQEANKSQAQTSPTAQPNVRDENASKTTLGSELKLNLPETIYQQVQNPPAVNSQLSSSNQNIKNPSNHNHQAATQPIVKTSQDPHSTNLQSSSETSQPNAPISRQTGAGASSNMRAAAAAAGGGGGADQTVQQHLAVQGVIRSYQARGHLISRLDPLGILDKGKTTLEQRKGLPPATITRQHKALEGIDLNTKFQLPQTTFVGQGESALPLKEIISRLENAYGNHIGAEYMYIHDMKKSLWIREQFESPKLLAVDKETKIRTLKRLIRAVHFEAFLAKKYTAEKRFGLEGCDVMIPCVKQLIDTSTDMGIEAINIAMAHRGRLNVLANVCRKSLKDIFTTFAGLKAEEEGSGDVKYHLGTVTTRENSYNKKKIRVAVVANASHLEPSGAICLGKTKCEQFLKGDTKGSTIMAIDIHGDAAFCGQGVVYEGMHLSYLPNYTTHGTIHIVVNNQVGFTTDPRFSRSSPYPTDVGRVVLAPIFHVNADDPDAVIQVSRIAAQWRQKFREDVVIDLVGYRRNGHNEMDEPMFTQPLMYQIIKKLPNVSILYGEQLIKEGLITQAEIDAYIKEYLDICEKDFAMAKNEKQIRYKDWLDSPWKGFFKNYKFTEFPKTGISEDILQKIGKAFSTPPPSDFVIHRGITRILKGRAKMVEERTTDWSLGEAFAYTSLMKDGYHVRLSGQDVERGTFSHRHHYLHHQTEDMRTFNMIANVFPNQAPYSLCNSSLSEFAVLGFEMGYSLVSPYMLVMWEGQFGDFANTGQVIFDQYLCSGQSKWYRQCGLVVQLPHGLEGAGPEHSSGRPERYLQLCDDDVIAKESFDMNFILHQHEHCNWFVANCSTPASLFHLLRRQMLLPFRKPCVLMTPKSFLRHPRAKSSFDEFREGTEFLRVLPDTGPASKAPDQVKKLIFCCGRTYYDIIEWIEGAKLESQIAVSRTEQLSPFPYDLVAAEINKYKSAKVFWAQEEHSNQGGWPYMHERINGATNNKIVCGYNGRAASSAPATGNKVMHLNEVADYKAQVLKV